ncbi:hypothetical protein D3C71_1178800 [compost metagenome]
MFSGAGIDDGGNLHCGDTVDCADERSGRTFEEKRYPGSRYLFGNEKEGSGYYLG